MGRTSTARERLLDATTDLIGTRSYNSLGVGDICAAADVRKGSFYYFFASKQALTIEAVDLHWTRQRRTWTATLQSPGSPLQRLKTLLLDTAALQRTAKDTGGFVHGCTLANLALELSTQEGAIRSRLEEVFDEQVELIAGVLTEASAAGEIPADHADVLTAQGVVAQIEGLVLLAKVRNAPEALDQLWPNIAQLIGAPGHRTGPPTPPGISRPAIPGLS